MSYLLDYNPGTQQWGYPRRGGFQLSGTIIVHTAECAADNDGEDTSAEGCANMIANRADWGSYHRLVDSDSIIDMLPWEYEAWQDTETNNWAVGISAALRTSDWATMPGDRRDRVYRNLAACAADFVRYMAGKGVTVPLRRITGAEARARVPGFCAHGDSGIARTDPGANFDWSLFFNYTSQALAGSITPQSATTTAPKEWDEMATKAEIFDAVWGGDGTPLIFNNELQRGEYPRTILGAMTDRIVRQQLIPLRAEVAGLVGALKAVAGGDSFDEAKLLEGVRAASAAGVKDAVDSIATTVTVKADQ